MPGLVTSSNKPSVGRAGKDPHRAGLPGSPGLPGAPGVPGDLATHQRSSVCTLVIETAGLIPSSVIFLWLGFSSSAVLLFCFFL